MSTTNIETTTATPTTTNLRSKTKCCLTLKRDAFAPINICKSVCFLLSICIASALIWSGSQVLNFTSQATKELCLIESSEMAANRGCWIYVNYHTATSNTKCGALRLNETFHGECVGMDESPSKDIGVEYDCFVGACEDQEFSFEDE
eukprot:417657_1